MVIVPRDEFLYTGHCVRTFVCDYWYKGCGECHHLGAYPAVKIDNTRFNWKRTQRIFLKNDVIPTTPNTRLTARLICFGIKGNFLLYTATKGRKSHGLLDQILDRLTAKKFDRLVTPLALGEGQGN